MNKIIESAAAVALLFATSLAIACEYPERPGMPDGNTASRDEMLAAKQDVQSYIAAVDEYLTCIEAEEKATIDELDNPDPEDLKRRDEMLNQKFDAANEEKALVAELFNQQIRAYQNQPKDAEE